MSRASPIQTNFSAGELSPLLLARVDAAKYYNGLKICENFEIMPHGGVTRRRGSIYVDEAFDSSAKTRLIPFEFSTTQAYIIELGNKYMRFFRDDSQIVVTPAITNATQANPCVITAAAHGFRNGDKVTISGVVGMTELNGNEYTVANVSVNTFELSGIDSTGYTAYSSGGIATGPYSIQTPWTTAEIFDIQFAQSADVMWLAHPSVKTQKLSRTGHTAWSLDFYDPTADPFVDPAPTTITGITQANPAVVTTSAAHGYATGDRISIKNVVGMTEVNGKTFTITVLTGTTFELDDIDSSGYTAYGSAGNAHTSTGVEPGCVTFFEQRLCFARTNNDPQKAWMTKSADYEDMSIGTADDDALAYSLASGKANVIQWIVGADDFLIGTSGSTHRARGTGGPLTPTNISVKRQTTHRCAKVQPVQLDNAVLFLQGTKKKIREMWKQYEDSPYQADDLTILSEHITGTGGLVELDHAQEPNTVLWGVRSDGQLVTLTYEKPQEVVAWARQAIGGVDAEVESVAIIPVSDHDQVWIAVKRTINGGTKRYIERLDSGLWTEQKNALYVDSAYIYSGAATRTITGLDHLEGETVQVFADGARYPDQVVSSGQISFSTDYDEFTLAHVGLACPSTIKTLEPEAGNPAGSSQGKLKQWGDVKIRFHRTLGGNVNGRDLSARDFGDLMNTAPVMQSGDVSVSGEDITTDGEIPIIQDAPLPMTVLGLFGDLSVGDN